MQSKRRAFVLAAPPALLIVVLFLVPLGIMAVFSFRAGAFGEARNTFTLENYQAFLDTPSYQRLLLQSVLLAAQVSVLGVILAYPLAYFLVFRAGPLRLTLLTMLIVPAWTSYLLRILAWKVILGSNGALNSLFLSLGWIDEAVPLLLFSRAAVLVTLVYVWIPFAALPIFSALERIDSRLLEASSDLGAMPFQTFLRVTLPLSLPGVTAAFFFVFIPTLGEWVTPALVGGAQGVMYGNLIQDQFVRALNWPMGSLMSLVMLVVVLAVTFVFTRMVRVTDVGLW